MLDCEPVISNMMGTRSELLALMESCKVRLASVFLLLFLLFLTIWTKNVHCPRVNVDNPKVESGLS